MNPQPNIASRRTAWIVTLVLAAGLSACASSVPLALAEIPLPFNLLAGFSTEVEPVDLAFFFVAMLLFPPAACDKMTAVCLAFIHRTGKGSGGEQGSQSFHRFIPWLIRLSGLRLTSAT